jgi:hypothetical protein
MSSTGKNFTPLLCFKSLTMYNLMNSGFKNREPMIQHMHTAYSDNIYSNFDSGSVVGVNVLNCKSGCTFEDNCKRYTPDES